jgi:hypothetical protein
VDFNSRVLDMLQKNSMRQTDNKQLLLNDNLRLLAKWRMELIRNTLLKNETTIVSSGPLMGLNFLESSTEGCHIPKLLGCYEQPLSPHISAAINTNYSIVIHVGCAEGYYAVGMAKKMTNTKSFAFDINTKAQDACTALAEKNNVTNRIEVGDIFQTEDFNAFRKKNVLVFCDIEGGEYDLLDPSKAPSLIEMDFIVETHNTGNNNGLSLLINRFKESHHITLVEDNGQRDLTTVAPWFRKLSHLDQLIAVWEVRSEPTPWLVMKSKKNNF